MSSFSINLLLGTEYPFDIHNAIRLSLTALYNPPPTPHRNIFPDEILYKGTNLIDFPAGTYYLTNGSKFTVDNAFDNTSYLGIRNIEYLDKTTGRYVFYGNHSIPVNLNNPFATFYIHPYSGLGNVDAKTGYLYDLTNIDYFGILVSGKIDPIDYYYHNYYVKGGDDPIRPSDFFINFFKDALYEQGPQYPISDNDIGVGDFDNSSDNIDFPTLPNVDILGTGFVRAYQPTQEQLVALSNYLWSDVFSLDTLKKMFADPMESLIGLSMVPVSPNVAENQNILFGNITTDIVANKILSQYVIFDCGEITLDEYFGGSLDYDPYTHIDIYLPFINIQTLNTNDVMGANLHLKYYIDIVTGSCVALLKVDKDNLNSIIYSWNGNCAMQIPVSASNNTSYLQSVLGVTASIATTAVTAYATKGASVAAQGAKKVGSEVAQSTAQAALTGSIIGTAESIVGGVSQMHTTIQRGGTMSGNLGFLSTLKPYLIITRPKQCYPRNFNTFEGQPSYVTNTLGDLTGYTKVYSVHLQNITATVEELNEIETLLKNGIIL